MYSFLCIKVFDFIIKKGITKIEPILRKSLSKKIRESSKKRNTSI